MKIQQILIPLASAVLCAQDPGPLKDTISKSVADAIKQSKIATKTMEGLNEKISERISEKIGLAMAQVKGMERGRGGEDSDYRRGTGALDAREWDNAIKSFSSAAERKGPRADGALYWKAYALNKMGRRDDSLATLAELQKAYATSRWLNDAKALEAEVRQSTGQPVSPEQEQNEELKIYAINSLVHTEPERALPLLEKILSSTGSPRMKERAVFVVAQIRTPQARDMVAKIALGNGNPDMQRMAIRYLGETRDKEAIQKLSDVYAASTDPGLKRAILSAYMRAKLTDRLLAAAAGETDKEVRAEAIHLLAAAGGKDDLWKMYPGADTDTRIEILRALHSDASLEKLQEILRQEKEPKIRREAIRMLSRHKTQQAADLLVSLYAGESDKSARRAVLDSLQGQQNGKALVEIARKESDLEMKKELVSRLSRMKSKEANDYLMELLK